MISISHFIQKQNRTGVQFRTHIWAEIDFQVTKHLTHVQPEVLSLLSLQSDKVYKVYKSTVELANKSVLILRLAAPVATLATTKLQRNG